MADPIEQELKKLNRGQAQIITLLETLVSLADGHLPAEKVDARSSEQIRVDARRQASLVPRGPIKPRYSASEMQSIHPSERARYE